MLQLTERDGLGVESFYYGIGSVGEENFDGDGFVQDLIVSFKHLPHAALTDSFVDTIATIDDFVFTHVRLPDSFEAVRG